MGKASYLTRLVGEVAQLARRKKAYWLLPMVLTLLLIGILVSVTEAAAPFIYTLF